MLCICTLDRAQPWIPASVLMLAGVCAGKTSFIAAVANLMRYSIYDLDLTSVSSNLDLRALLTQVMHQDRRVWSVCPDGTASLACLWQPRPGLNQSHGAICSTLWCT